MTLDAERLERKATRFRRFAEIECRGYSPLYERISLGIAEDRELLELTTHARPGQPVQLILGCVHLLLLTGTQHPVARRRDKCALKQPNRRDSLRMKQT